MGNTISREELCNKYKEYESEMKTISSVQYDYKVAMPLNGMGLVRKMSMNDLILAFGVVNEYTNVKKAAMEALGITDKDFAESDASYLGVPVTDWVSDMKVRATEIRNKKRMDELNKILTVIKRNLGADDMFLLDMESIADIL